MFKNESDDIISRIILHLSNTNNKCWLWINDTYSKMLPVVYSLSC